MSCAHEETEVVNDSATGDTVCTACGLVLEHHFIDDRTVTVHQHVGEFFLSDDKLSDAAHDAFASMCAGLKFASELGQNIKDGATEMFKKLEKNWGNIPIEAIYVVCMQSVCRKYGATRTLEELCDVSGAEKKKILRARDYIVKSLGMDCVGSTHAKDFVRIFCSDLGIFEHRFIRAAEECSERVEQRDERRLHKSIAAGVIYLLTQVSEQKKSVAEIVAATTVSGKTIKQVYEEDLLPHQSEIIPDWYARGR